MNLIQFLFLLIRAFLIAQLIKNPSAVQETRVGFLGWEDPLEKEMATHSSIIAWRIPWTEKPGRFPVHGVARVRQDLVTKSSPPRASLVAQMVKNPPVMQATRARSLSREYPLEKAMAIHSSILAWRIPWTDHGVAKSRTRLSG